MARTQSPQAMSFAPFDPGIAQSIMTQKDINSKEKIAMADIEGRNQTAAMQAGAQTESARIGANAEMAMNSQRLAAQRSAQDAQNANDMRMKQMDNEFTRSLQRDQARFEEQMQWEVLNNQNNSEDIKWSRGLELFRNTMAYDTKKSVIGTVMNLNMMKQIMGTMEGQQAALDMMDKEAELGQQRDMKRTYIDGYMKQAVSPGSSEWKEGAAMYQIQEANQRAGEVYGGTTGSEAFLTRVLSKNGLTKITAKDLMGGSDAIATNLIKKIESNEVGLEDLHSLVTMVDAAADQLKGEQKDSFGKAIQSRFGEILGGIHQVRMNGSEPVKKKMEAVSGWVTGNTFSQVVAKQLKDTGRMDIDSMLNLYKSMLEGMNLSVTGETANMFREPERMLRQGLNAAQGIQQRQPVRTEGR